eukprot:431095-Prymnesium_polylepis.1
MSGRGKGGKGLGSAKRAKPSEYEWTENEEVFSVGHCVVGDNENSLFIVPVKEVDSVLAHVVARSTNTSFMWNLEDEGSLEDFFELITKSEYNAISDKCDGGQDSENGEEEDDNGDEDIEDKEEVIEGLREWLRGLERFSKPPSQP